MDSIDAFGGVTGAQDDEVSATQEGGRGRLRRMGEDDPQGVGGGAET